MSTNSFQISSSAIDHQQFYIYQKSTRLYYRKAQVYYLQFLSEAYKSCMFIFLCIIFIQILFSHIIWVAFGA